TKMDLGGSPPGGRASVQAGIEDRLGRSLALPDGDACGDIPGRASRHEEETRTGPALPEEGGACAWTEPRPRGTTPAPRSMETFEAPRPRRGRRGVPGAAPEPFARANRPQRSDPDGADRGDRRGVGRRAGERQYAVGRDRRGVERGAGERQHAVG